VAGSLFNALCSRKVAIEPVLKVENPERSVHHGFYDSQHKSWVRPFLVTMKAMYKAGFRDIDVPDSSGRTPLMTAVCNLHDLDMVKPGCYVYNLTNKVQWLVSKGANLFRVLPRSSATTFHYLACVLFFRKIGLYIAGYEKDALDKYIFSVPTRGS
jgi:hypothetical protein